MIPEISDKIRGLVGAESLDRLEGQLKWGTFLESKALSGKTILFPRPKKK